MSRETLFDDLPEAGPVGREWSGSPRLREPIRDQVELRVVDLEALLADEHPARVIWAYVQKLDLSALEETVRARTPMARGRRRQPAPATGVVAVCHEPGRRERSGTGTALREP
jgi:hypothetical protein